MGQRLAGCPAQSGRVRLRPRLSPGGGLGRYVLTCSLLRTADAGAVLAVVLVVAAEGGPGWVAGLLGASLTVPYLLGPFLVRVVDGARDGRRILAGACLIRGVSLSVAVVLYSLAGAGASAALLFVAGLVGPLLTGGISSRLPGIVGPDLPSLRRAYGWDVATFGLGAMLGPSIVAALSAWISPTAAALVLSGATLVGAGLVRVLPPTPSVAMGEVPRPMRTLGLMARRGALRRTLYLTTAVALAVAVLPITAVASTPVLGVAPAAAGLLTAAFGLGYLTGSLAVVARPPSWEADRLMTALALCVGTGLACTAAAPTFVLAITGYAITGILNAYFLSATMAARSEYAPANAAVQVFVWVGAIKTTVGSVGTAAAAAIIERSAYLPITIGVSVVAVAAVLSMLDRRMDRTGRS